ncbi:MAG: UDP-N-acetylglucosamine--N-acetylmuramyl-(pentapeptide) pyrophosphoryl-undecaprenol N-acetylglucosamine transferase [Patescibacteria group bacterium]
MKFVFAGGGTAGSVIPLISVYHELKKNLPDSDLLFIGTISGNPEKSIVEQHGIRFTSIFCGKLRRYFDFRNILDIVLIAIGFFQSLKILVSYKPSAVVSAGSYVGVPVIYAAKLLNIPVLIHQQDIRPSLSNRLTAWIAGHITVSFDISTRFFNARKTSLTGNPFRPDILNGNPMRAISQYKFDEKIPTILIMGGGTGARFINQLVCQSIGELTKNFQIIHITGAGKSIQLQDNSRYIQREFMAERMPDAYALASIVVARAGISTCTELMHLGKPSILIPLPNSHQEDNAQYFLDRSAVLVIEQDTATAKHFVETIRNLQANKVELQTLSKTIRTLGKTDAAQKIAQAIIGLCKK